MKRRHLFGAAREGPVSAAFFEVHQTLDKVTIHHRLRGESNAASLNRGVQQVAHLDANLFADIQRNDHLIFVFNRNQRHKS